MIWVATLVPLGALGVTALGLYLNFRERVGAHRSALYGRQLEAYMTLESALSQLTAEIITLIATSGHVLDESGRVAVRRLMAESQASALYGEAFRDYATILPRAVVEALVDYRHVLNAVSAPAAVATQYPAELVSSSDPAMDVSISNSRVIAAMREHAGIDNLSAQTLKMIGSAPTAK